MWFSISGMESHKEKEVRNGGKTSGAKYEMAGIDIRQSKDPRGKSGAS